MSSVHARVPEGDTSMERRCTCVELRAWNGKNNIYIYMYKRYLASRGIPDSGRSVDIRRGKSLERGQRLETGNHSRRALTVHERQ